MPIICTGGVMSFPLPIGFMRWLDGSKKTILMLQKYPQTVAQATLYSFYLEYPAQLHDDHNCYPLAPEHILVQDEKLFSHSQQFLKELHAKYRRTMQGSGKTSKIPTLENKKHYVLHYINLQLCMSPGMKIFQIHRILEFLRTLADDIR